MDTRTEPIRQDIDSIRDSMTDKMEQIEAQIKGTVADTTETLKRGLDVKYQVSEHPWAAIGVAVLAGYALGSMGSSDSSPSTYRYRDDFRYNDSRSGEPMRYYNAGPASESSHQGNSGSHAPNTGQSSHNASYSYQGGQQSSSGGFLNDVMGQLGGELDTFKTAAIASLVSLVRDTVKQNLPGVYDEAERLRSGSQSYNQGARSASGSSNYGSSTASYGTGGTSSSTSAGAARTYGNDSSAGSSRSVGASGPSTGGSGEGEFYREADITEGSAPRYDRTTEMYPAGSSQPDQDPTSTQRDVGRNPNYDMIPPSPHANPDGRP